MTDTERIAQLEQQLEEAKALLVQWQTSYEQVADQYGDIYAEYRAATILDHRAYWQGKKDGFRLVMAALAPDPKTRRRWASLQESSRPSKWSNHDT